MHGLPKLNTPAVVVSYIQATVVPTPLGKNFFHESALTAYYGIGNVPNVTAVMTSLQRVPCNHEIFYFLKSF